MDATKRDCRKSFAATPCAASTPINLINFADNVTNIYGVKINVYSSFEFSFQTCHNASHRNDYIITRLGTVIAILERSAFLREKNAIGLKCNLYECRQASPETDTYTMQMKFILQCGHMGVQQNEKCRQASSYRPVLDKQWENCHQDNKLLKFCQLILFRIERALIVSYLHFMLPGKSMVLFFFNFFNTLLFCGAHPRI